MTESTLPAAETTPNLESSDRPQPDTFNPLQDPDQCPGCDVVIYDGECNFCRAAVKNLRRLDWGGMRLAYLSLHDSRVASWYPDLTREELMEQMYVVDQQNRRHGGADAVRYLSRRLPTLWLAAPILHLPGTAGIWRRLYREVAKRRYRLAGKSCDSGSCSIH